MISWSIQLPSASTRSEHATITSLNAVSARISNPRPRRARASRRGTWNVSSGMTPRGSGEYQRISPGATAIGNQPLAYASRSVAAEITPARPPPSHFRRLLRHPFRRRLDGRERRGPRVRASAAFEPADRADGHVVVAHDLAGETDAGQPARVQYVLLGRRRHGRLPGDELDAARRAPRVPAARVKLIDLHVLFEREHHALAVGHV